MRVFKLLAIVACVVMLVSTPCGTHAANAEAEATALSSAENRVAAGGPFADKVQDAFAALRKKAASAKKALKWKRSKKKEPFSAEVLANLEKLHKEKADSLEKFCKPFAEWELLGQGFFGRVYKVAVTKPDGPFKDKPFVAVKILLAERLSDVEEQKRIETQVSFMGELMANAFIAKEGGHPNIAASLGLFNAKIDGKDSPVLVVEYLEGYNPLPAYFTPRGQLDEALKDQTDLEESAVATLRAAADDARTRFVADWADILKDILAAVSWMHGKQIFHNDLHGGNVLLKELSPGKYSVKLIDNGLVTAAEKSDAAKFGVLQFQRVLNPIVSTACDGGALNAGFPYTDAYALAVLSEATAGFASLGTTFFQRPTSLLQTESKLWRRIHKKKRNRVPPISLPSSLRGGAFDFQMVTNDQLTKDQPTELVNEALKEALSPEQAAALAEGLAVGKCSSPTRTQVTVVEIARKFGIAPKKTFAGQVKRLVANLKLFKPGSPSAKKENEPGIYVERPTAEYVPGDEKQAQEKREVILNRSGFFFNARTGMVGPRLNGPDSNNDAPEEVVVDTARPADPYIFA